MNRLHFTVMLLFAALPMMAERVAPETARKAAQTFLNNNGAKSAQLTDLSKAAGFANLYIFNADQGFVVMAADDCAQPILGYSLTGSFVAEDMPENLKWWLQGYSDQIQSAIDNQTRATSETAKQWKDLIDGNNKAAKATIVVAPLITSRWDQGFPYNNLCPTVGSGGSNGRAYTGCVATAMAQILNYWKYPSRGVGTATNYHNGNTLNADFGAATYAWNDMPDHINCYYQNDQLVTCASATAQQQNAVATLMYHCGMSVMMGYGGQGSGAFPSYVYWALKDNFNYSSSLSLRTYNTTSWSWVEYLKTDLGASMPVFYYGDSPSNAAHAFVCDGYDSENFFHFNFGWSGYLDGWFKVNGVTPGDNDFSSNIMAIFGIKPSVCTAAAPTNLTSIKDGREVRLNWTAATGASGYAVYRNNVLVATVNTNTYSETAPIGTNSYYVRSKDSSADMSLASNAVTVVVQDQFLAVDDMDASVSNDKARLSWTIPPRLGTTVLSYDESEEYNGTGARLNCRYIANKFSSGYLSPHVGKGIYKVSLPISGAATLRIYNNSKNEKPDLDSLVFVKSIRQNGNAFWTDFTLDRPILITGATDIWVVVELEAQALARYFGDYNVMSSFSYFSIGGISDLNIFSSGNWYMRTYLTGNCTYDIYRNDQKIGEDLALPSFTADLIDNNVNKFVVKAKYNNNVSGNSNAVSVAKGSVSVNNLTLDRANKMVITNGATLAVNAALTNNDEDNLVIGDKAQLIHSNDGVKATVKKGIIPYKTQEDGWNFIASPVASSNLDPSEVSGLLGTDNDLYYYDEPRQLWINYYQNQDFDLASTQGYLYSCGGESSAVPMKNLVFKLNGLAEGGWTTFNANGNGNGWNNLTSNAVGNYLVSPQVTFSSSTRIKFKVKNSSGRTSKNKFIVAYSIDGNSDASDFVCLYEKVISGSLANSEISVSFPSSIEGNTGYIAIGHIECVGTLSLVDNPVEIENVLEERIAMLSFKGQIKGSANAVPVPLSHTSNIALTGFNLVGNPFVCNATIDFGDFYVLNADGSEIILADAGHQIAPCEAVFVKATETGQSVTFSKATASKGHGPQASLDLIVKRGKTIIDRARVRHGEGTSMEKFSLNGNQGSRIYFPIGGNNYAVSVIASDSEPSKRGGADIALNISTNEMPVNFKTAKDGTYTLAVETNSLDLDYLHLIDNLTGNDIDLLATPNYTFEAKTTDYASRFRLVFNANDASTGSASFAYVSNGEIVINDADAHSATLQVVDVMGRVILCSDAKHCVSTSGMTAGVYILRLIEGNDVKTQKIVIE